ncbi:MAG: uracil phosphoribosyltransferase [Acidimicrobiia bacterium]
MQFTVVDHPLAAHYLSILRDERTEPEAFRAAARRLTYHLVETATEDAKLAEYPLQTPLEATSGYRFPQMVAVAVLRAGLGMLDAVVDLLPGVKVGYAGVQRNEETAQPEEYYVKFPVIGDARVLILEPMLATGGSLSWAIDRVKEAGGTDITALCCVVAPEGVERLEADHSDVRLVAASLDDGLTDTYYIRPGLGDMGDRLFDTP